MLSNETLNLIWLALAKNPEKLRQLRTETETLFVNSDYQTWHRAEPRAQFQGPVLRDCPRLRESRLIDDEGRLEVKINKIGERIFLTDGAWFDSRMRVFPDPDEAQLICDYAKQNGLTEWADWLIDPASGCGHTPLGYEGRARRIGCDANARAITYASLNAKLNSFGSDAFFPLMNNMLDGFPKAMSLEGRVLFLSNVPFAPAPRQDALALNSDGGTSGADLQLASFRMVRDFHERGQNPVRACFVTWTVGRKETDQWEVPELCREVFQGHSVNWTLVDHDYDARDLPNPSPLREMLLYLARSQYAVGKTSSTLAKEYEVLATRLEARGDTHIAYGVLECHLG